MVRQIAHIDLCSNEFKNNNSSIFRHVASYGNSDPAFIDKWVPIQYSNFPIVYTSEKKKKSLVSSGCNGIVTSFHILVTYALTGPIDFPQAKIIGVLYKRGDPIKLPSFEENSCNNKAECGAQDFSIDVATTVTFMDKTSPPKSYYAQWPSISIRLPADFFYPFSVLVSSSDCASLFISKYVIFITTLAITFL